jgi:hypothetical protein
MGVMKRHSTCVVDTCAPLVARGPYRARAMVLLQSDHRRGVSTSTFEMGPCLYKGAYYSNHVFTLPYSY